MSQTLKSFSNIKLSKSGKTERWFAFVALVIGLAIFQDYLFSQFQNTGFYLSESLLYNSIWLFFLPLGILELRVLKRFPIESKTKKGIGLLALGAIFSLLHILIFSAFFVAVSFLVFSPSHNFSHIFSSALSNQLYILFLFYAAFPLVIQLIGKSKKQNSIEAQKYSNHIQVKAIGSLKTIPSESIVMIATDKPYTIVFTESGKYHDDRTLKDFESLLDPQYFHRAHRSVMINSRHVSELKSRQNGDYDALLDNGETVRLSRHLRHKWSQLLH